MGSIQIIVGYFEHFYKPGVNVAGVFQISPSSDMAAVGVPVRHHVMNDKVTGDSEKVKQVGHQVFPTSSQSGGNLPAALF